MVELEIISIPYMILPQVSLVLFILSIDHLSKRPINIILYLIVSYHTRLWINLCWLLSYHNFVETYQFWIFSSFDYYQIQEREWHSNLKPSWRLLKTIINFIWKTYLKVSNPRGNSCTYFNKFVVDLISYHKFVEILTLKYFILLLQLDPSKRMRV